MGGVQNLPVVGEVTLKVRLMVYDKKVKGKEKLHYSCGFAHFRYQDCLSTVYDDGKNSHDYDDDKYKQGTIGATMGGHHFMSRFIPNHEAYSKGKDTAEWIDVIIDNRDIWYAIDKMLQDPEAKKALLAAAEQYPIDEKNRRVERERKAAEKEAARLKKEEEELDAEAKAICAGTKRLEKELAGD